MSKAYIMIGCPGVGKDTYIQNYLPNIPVLSSDSIRMEIFNTLNNQSTEANSQVFNLLNQRMTKLTKEQADVIHNATNLSIKRRSALYKQLKHKGYEVVAVVGQLSLQELYNRNRNRPIEQQVPEDKIKNMYQSLTPPIIGVDCDKHILFTEPYFKDTVNFDTLDNIIESIKNPYIQNELLMNKTSHGSVFHKESVDEHINSVINESKQYNHEIALTGVFHDLGKGICKTINPKTNKYVFYNHEKYGSMLAFNYLSNHVELNSHFIKYDLLHMAAFNMPFTEKFINRYNLTSKDIDNLTTFNQIDRKCTL